MAVSSKGTEEWRLGEVGGHDGLEAHEGRFFDEGYA